MAEISKETQQLEKAIHDTPTAKGEPPARKKSEDSSSSAVMASSSSDNARSESLANCWATPEYTELENALNDSPSAEEKANAFNKLLEFHVNILSMGLSANENDDAITQEAYAIHKLLRSFGFHFIYSESCIEGLCKIFSTESLPFATVRLVSESLGMLTLLSDPRISDTMIKAGIVGIALRHIKATLKSIIRTASSTNRCNVNKEEDERKGETPSEDNSSEQTGKSDATNTTPVRRIIENYSDEERALTGCLWALCNVSLNPNSHKDFITEEATKLLIPIVMITTITTHAEYSLCILANLIQYKEAMNGMLRSEFAKDLTGKACCGFPIIERWSLSILSKLCTADKSMIPTVADKDFFESLIKRAPEKDVKSIFRGKCNGHRFLQLIRFLTSCVTTEGACRAFIDAGGVPWLKMVYCESTAKKPYSPTLISHIAALVANVLSFGAMVLPTWTMSQGSSIYTIVALLNYNKNMLVQKDTARAVSYMMPYYVERRTVVFGKGFFKAFLKIIDCDFNEYPVKDALELQLYTLRSMVLIGLGYNKTYEMLIDKRSIGVIGNVITFSSSPSIPTDLRGLADNVLLEVLDFIGDMFEGLKISSFFNIKELFVKHPAVGLQGVTNLLSSRNRLIQISAMKLLVEYSTFCQSREWIDTNKVVPEDLLQIDANDDAILTRCLQHQITRFRAIVTFPYDKSTPPVPLPRLLATPMKSADDGRAKAESQDGAGVVGRTNRRGRRRAFALQQNADQLSTSIVTIDSVMPQMAQLEGISDFDDGKRVEVLTDFVLSERSYVSDLNKVIWLYFKPLYHIQITKIMNRNVSVFNKFVRLFSLLEYIVDYSTAFLNVIENRTCEKHVRVGDVLKAFSVCFDYYVEYTKILSEFIAEIEDPNCLSPLIDDYIDRVEHDSQSEGLSMKEQLTYPLNRAEVYINFLKKLLSYNKDEDTPIIEEVYKNSLSTLTKLKKPEEEKEEQGAQGAQEQGQSEKEEEKGKGGKGGTNSSDDDEGPPSEKNCKTVDTLFSGVKGYKYGLELESLAVRDIGSGATVEKYEGNSSKLILFEEYFLLVQLRVDSYKLISKIHIEEAIVEDTITNSIKIRSSSCCDLEYLLTFSDPDKKDLIYNILKK